MSKKRGLLFVMSGPSGTGKGTICNELIKHGGIFLSVSSTTREMRIGETPGVTYNYVSVSEFEELIANGEMLEYAKYGQNYYGTPKKAVTRMLEAGKNVLLEIEPQGALSVKNKIPDAVLIFLLPPSASELKKRLTERGRESEDEINERLKRAEWELLQAPLYNRTFVNADLAECVDAVEAYIRARSDEREFLDKLTSELSEIVKE